MLLQDTFLSYSLLYARLQAQCLALNSCLQKLVGWKVFMWIMLGQWQNTLLCRWGRKDNWVANMRQSSGQWITFGIQALLITASKSQAMSFNLIFTSHTILLCQVRLLYYLICTEYRKPCSLPAFPHSTIKSTSKKLQSIPLYRCEIESKTMETVKDTTEVV